MLKCTLPPHNYVTKYKMESLHVFTVTLVLLQAALNLIMNYLRAAITKVRPALRIAAISTGAFAFTPFVTVLLQVSAL